MKSGGRPSARWHDEFGFTLVEILVVLAIMALLAVWFSSLVSTSRPDVKLSVAAEELADELRLTRNMAISRNEMEWLVLRSADASYRPSFEGTIKRLPSGTRVSFVGSRDAARDPAGIAFYPDGSSNGGRVRLTLQGVIREIDVRWLTGQIVIVQESRQ